MKKIMSIFSVVLFAFALTLSSCGESNADKASVECSADCAKACCLGCKATEGNKKCIKLEDGTMPCCAGSSDDETCANDCAKECCAGTATSCCCGDETCDGSCHNDTTAHEHEGGEEHSH